VIVKSDMFLQVDAEQFEGFLFTLQ
jgi:hypothetical protein